MSEAPEKQQLHVMLDLETLGTSTLAAIHEIGWALFRIEDDAGVMLNQGSILVDPQSCIHRGMWVEWEAVAFWLKQEMAEPGQDLNGALMELDKVFHSFNENQELAGVWSHGASFDVPILETAYRFCVRKAPWSHRVVRDTRTLFSLVEIVPWAENLVKHSAVHDAVAQAATVQATYRKLRNFEL